MNKCTLTLALVLSVVLTACLSAKVIPTKVVGVRNDYSNPKTLNVDVSTSTVVDDDDNQVIYWNSFDLDKGYTVNFYNIEAYGGVSNIITSGKASTLNGNINAYVGVIDAGNEKGNVYMYNAKGFSVGKTFVFKGSEFGLGLSTTKDLILKVNMQYDDGIGTGFAITKGSFDVNAKGAVSGNAYFQSANKDAFEKQAVEINAGNQNVTIGNIVTGTDSAAKFSIIGKDIKTGSVEARCSGDSVTMTASGSIATGNYTHDEGVTSTLKAAKNVTLGDLNYTGTEDAPMNIQAGKAVTIGSITADYGDAETSGEINISAGTIKTGSGYYSDTEAYFNATDSITMGNIDIYDGSMSLDAGNNANLGTLTVYDAGFTVEAVKSIKVGLDVKAENYFADASTVNILGGYNATVSMGQTKMFDGSSLKVTGKTVSVDKFTGDDENTKATFQAYSALNVGDIQLDDAGTYNFYSDNSLNLGNIEADGTKLLETKAVVASIKNITLNGVEQMNIGPRYGAGSVTVGDINTTESELNVYGTNSKITNLTQEGGDVKIAVESLTIGTVEEAYGGTTTFTIGSSATFGDITIEDNEFTIKGEFAKNIKTGVVYTQGTSFTVDTEDAAVLVGGIDSQRETTFNFNADTVAIGDIYSLDSNDTFNIYALNNKSTVKLGNAYFEDGANVTVNATKNISFASFTGTTLGSATISSDEGNISGGSMTAQNVTFKATEGSVTMTDVRLGGGENYITAKRKVTMDSLVNGGNSTLSSGALAFGTVYNYSTLAINGDTAVAVKNLTNGAFLNVYLTKGYFTADRMTENGGEDGSFSYFETPSFTANAYESGMGGEMCIENCVKGFTIGSSDAKGTIYLNTGSYQELPKTISINRGAFFHELIYCDNVALKDRFAVKKITARNFQDLNSWGE